MKNDEISRILHYNDVDMSSCPGGLMPEIKLVPVTEDNFSQVVALSHTLTDEQKKCVASNERSLAQAYVHVNIAWPRAIVLDDKPIGFVMLSYDDTDIPDEDRPALYLWRYMIGRDHQSKGYGKKVMDLLIEKAREEGFRSFYTSCDIKGPMPYQFYIKYGFIDTHTMDDDEEVLKYML